MRHIAVLTPSGSVKHPLHLEENLTSLESLGFIVSRPPPLSEDPLWPYTAASLNDRLQAFEAALFNPEVDILLMARGGYGASELLPHLPWEKLRTQNPKHLVGFSDASALLSAFDTKLQWPVTHAPMPDSLFWKDPHDSDLKVLLSLFREETIAPSLPLSFSTLEAPLAGPLWGGCLSVLTNLIGTPYLPETLKNRWLFFEDIGESPPQVFRALVQWKQAGLLEGIAGMLLGSFQHPLFEKHWGDFLKKMTHAFSVSIAHSPLFGHQSPNFPLPFGALATVSQDMLSYGTSCSVKDV